VFSVSPRQHLALSQTPSDPFNYRLGGVEQLVHEAVYMWAGLVNN